MLRKDDFAPIGYTKRSHGIIGELACQLELDIYDALEEESNFFLMLEEEGLLIPYRVLKLRRKGNDIDLILFEGIDSKEQAEKICKRTIWLSKDYIDTTLSTDPYDFSRYIGFSVYDAEQKQLLGRIRDVDDSTLNTLLYVTREQGDEIILPIAPELLKTYNDSKQSLHLLIPQGLLEDNPS